MAFYQDIDLGDISGGNAGTVLGDITPNRDTSPTSGASTAAVAAVSPTIDEFVASEGRLLAVASGEHLVGGQLLANKREVGPPPKSTVDIALGEGAGQTTEGEWEAVVKAWYAAEEIPALALNASTGFGYQFRPGKVSSGVADPVQGISPLMPNGLAYSGTARLTVAIPQHLATEDRPDKLRARCKTRKMWDYNESGQPLNYAYTVNPADFAVDRIRAFFMQRYDNIAIAQERTQARVCWSCYYDWWFYNAALITWDDGTTPNRQIQRFECHAAFTTDLTLADALDQICACAGAWWQDDGHRIHFLTPVSRAPIHHFHTGNIVKSSVQVLPRDIRDVPNYFTAKFRDLDDPYLGEVSVTVERPDLIAKVGKRASERQFFNMRRSQAQRLLERQARIEADARVILALRGFGDSLHVLPGDFVTVSHSIPGWSHQRCLVLDATLDSIESRVEGCDFTLLKVDGELYSDAAHGPVQLAIAP